MAMTVTMPQLGESVTEGTIARWLKQPGEPVAKYESIAEVVTDKVNAEIPSPAEGSMGEIIAKEGAVIAVGEPICTIETVEQGQAGAAPAAEAQPAEAQAAEAQPAQAQPEQQPAQPEQQPAPEPVVAGQAQAQGGEQPQGRSGEGEHAHAQAQAAPAQAPQPPATAPATEPRPLPISLPAIPPRAAPAKVPVPVSRASIRTSRTPSTIPIRTVCSPRTWPRE